MNDAFLKTNQDKALRTMQELEMEGLKEIDRICRKHNINYSLGGGTCLGQIRHGGFIPWDDDIDVDMTYENYNRFMEVAPAELDPERFFLRCRKTDPTHYRTASRLEILGTRLSIPRWDAVSKEGRVFVDIFRWNYLPDEEEERKKIATKLFLCRCIQTYKEHGKYAKQLKREDHFKVRLAAKLFSKKTVEKHEDKLANCTHGEKTGWIMDDSIIHGDYGGYPSEGVDEYEDTSFEGLRVMNKKNCHNFLKTIYGPHYNEWLPPAKRISHHAWTVIDFGEFDQKYHLDPSYKESLSVQYTPNKLKHMKKVANSMVADAASVCKKHGLRYAIAVPDYAAAEEPMEGVEELWEGAPIIMMPRKDYETFGEVFEGEFGGKYFYQTHETEPAFLNMHARIRLNLTKIREKKALARKEELYNSGFYVKVIPMDPISEDKKEQARVIKRLKVLRRCLRSRERYLGFRSFLKMKWKAKAGILLSIGKTEEDLYREITQLMRSFEGQKTSLCFDSTFQIESVVMKESKIKDGKELPLIKGGPFLYPTMEDFIRRISRRFGPCYLTYYEEPENQLSVLRYDHETDRFLTNEEILENAGL